MADDILAAIDAATGCQQCGGSLAGSVSDDFCCAEHQAAWHAQHTEALVGYREPWRRPDDFPGIGTDSHSTSTTNLGAFLAETDQLTEYYSPGSATFVLTPEVEALLRARVTEAHAWRLPRLTGDVGYDMRVALQAAASATTAEQRAAVALRQQMLAEQMRPQFEALGRGLQEMVEGFAKAFSSAAEAVAEWLRKAFALPDPPVAIQHQRAGRPEVVSLQEQALRARRNRNTGPPRRERPPRRVDPRGGLYR